MNLDQIMSSFFAQLDAAALGYPIAWPGVPFTPPASGIWLEPAVLPNNGLDNGLAATDEVVEQGLCQVIVWTRPALGMVGVSAAARQVAEVFPKNSSILGLIRVQRSPYMTVIDSESDKVGVLVTVPYSG